MKTNQKFRTASLASWINEHEAPTATPSAIRSEAAELVRRMREEEERGLAGLPSTLPINLITSGWKPRSIADWDNAVAYKKSHPHEGSSMDFIYSPLVTILPIGIIVLCIIIKAYF